jgi:hypothetical protein
MQGWPQAACTRVRGVEQQRTCSNSAMAAMAVASEAMDCSMRAWLVLPIALPSAAAAALAACAVAGACQPHRAALLARLASRLRARLQGDRRALAWQPGWPRGCVACTAAVSAGVPARQCAGRAPGSSAARRARPWPWRRPRCRCRCSRPPAPPHPLPPQRPPPPSPPAEPSTGVSGPGTVAPPALQLLPHGSWWAHPADLHCQLPEDRSLQPCSPCRACWPVPGGAGRRSARRAWRTWLSVNSWYLDATNRRSRVFASSSACARTSRLSARFARWRTAHRALHSELPALAHVAAEVQTTAGRQLAARARGRQWVPDEGRSRRGVRAAPPARMTGRSGTPRPPTSSARGAPGAQAPASHRSTASWACNLLRLQHIGPATSEGPARALRHQAALCRQVPAPVHT